MKILPVFLLIVLLATACTNNATLTGVNNSDTVVLQDEFGRDAYPEWQPDTTAGRRDSAARQDR